MNKYLLITTICFLCACNNITTKNNAEINFSSKTYDFGKIKFKTDTACSFSFKNIGETPLIIHEVKTSCGCTVPEWTKKPIKKGRTSEIKVKYDAGFPGVFHKTITVFYNGKDSPRKLEVKGEVEYPDSLATQVETQIREGINY